MTFGIADEKTDEHTFFVYFEYSPLEFNYSTYSIAGHLLASADGIADKFDTSKYMKEVTSGNFATSSGGLGYEFGQIFDPLTFSWDFWNYDSQREDWIA